MQSPIDSFELMTGDTISSIRCSGDFQGAACRCFSRSKKKSWRKLKANSAYMHIPVEEMWTSVGAEHLMADPPTHGLPNDECWPLCLMR